MTKQKMFEKALSDLNNLVDSETNDLGPTLFVDILV